MIEQRVTVGKIGENGAGMKCPNCSNEQESGNICGKCCSSIMEPGQHEQSAAYSEAAAGIML